MVHVPRRYHLAEDRQKRRYDLHRNDPADEGYCRFLFKLIDPLVARLEKNAKGLDYGSGPEPVLAGIMSARGFRVEIYDPHYASNREVLAGKYDFLTCCETMEHFSDPASEWKLFMRLVRRGGWIAIMTQMLEDTDDFARWHYINDETHVCFFSEKTFEWLGGKYGTDVFIESTSVVLCRVR